MTTVLLSPEDFAKESCDLEGDVYRHLFRARRLAVEDRLRVVDGLGNARWATVARVERHRAALELGAAAPSNEPELRLDVWVSAPKPGRAAWMVEKLTELGVGAVRLWQTERSPRSYGSGQLERLKRMAVAAVAQSGRSRLPEVTGPHPWGEGIERLGRVDTVVVLAPGGGAWSSLPTLTGTAALCVGPEGGWTTDERGSLAALGARSIGLGETILRVETAAIVGASGVLLSR